MIVLYLILMIGLVFFYILYSDDLSFIILLSAASVPIVMYAQLFYTSHRIKIRSSSVSERVRKGESPVIGVSVTNPTIFPMPLAKFRIKCVVYPSGVCDIRRVTVPLPAKSTRRLSITIHSDYCSRVGCEVSHIRMYDMLHLFYADIKKNNFGSLSVDFFPSGDFEIDGETCGRLSMPASSSDTISPRRNNAQIPEYDELREYRDGDKLNRIAWKLSGRNGSDELIVRDSGNLSSPAVMLAADTASAKDSSDADRIYECFYEAAHILLEHDKQFDSVSSEGGMISCISSEADIDRCMSLIYGESLSAEKAAEIISKRRYDEIYIVSSEDYSPERLEIIRERSAAACRISVIRCAEKGSGE